MGQPRRIIAVSPAAFVRPSTFSGLIESDSTYGSAFLPSNNELAGFQVLRLLPREFPEPRVDGGGNVRLTLQENPNCRVSACRLLGGCIRR